MKEVQEARRIKMLHQPSKVRFLQLLCTINLLSATVSILSFFCTSGLILIIICFCLLEWFLTVRNILFIGASPITFCFWKFYLSLWANTFSCWWNIKTYCRKHIVGNGYGTWTPSITYSAGGEISFFNQASQRGFLSTKSSALIKYKYPLRFFF